MRCGTGEAELHGESRPAGPALRWEVKGRRNAALPTDVDYRSGNRRRGQCLP
jgi:hypothetical protein